MFTGTSYLSLVSINRLDSDIEVTFQKEFAYTPSPWLTRICFTQISLTRIFQKSPFLT